MVTKYKNRIAVKVAISSVGIGRVATSKHEPFHAIVAVPDKILKRILRLQHLDF